MVGRRKHHRGVVVSLPLACNFEAQMCHLTSFLDLGILKSFLPRRQHPLFLLVVLVEGFVSRLLFRGTMLVTAPVSGGFTLSANVALCDRESPSWRGRTRARLEARPFPTA